MLRLQESNIRLHRVRRIVVNLFLVFHILAILAWILPLQSLLITHLKQLIRPYMMQSGLHQGWDMFAPEPLSINTYVDAEVTFDDGSTRAWSFPDVRQLNLADQYMKERYRKYTTDYLRLDAYPALWADAARYIARRQVVPSNRPVRVVLVRHWWKVPPPSANGTMPFSAWDEHPFFVYDVQPADL